MDAPHTLLSERYRLVRVIAAGGMGVVWEGWDELLERPVAVKQLRTQPGVSEEEAETAKNRAMREARIAARLHHPNAVPVFDAVEQDGQPCLVMQYVPSTPLSALLRDDGPLPPREAARIGAQVASALAAAHRLGIVHRDIKPGNVLLDEDGRALISDFGISRALGDTTLTSTGLVHGTPAYLAPEVARGEDSSFASDVFSLGSTLYAAVEGTPPFGTDANSIAVLHRVAMGDFAPPRHAGALTPLLLDMLAADPSRRPPMSQVAARLDQLRNSAESEPTTRLLPGRDTEPDETAAFDEDSRPTAVLPVAAAAAVAAAAVPEQEPEAEPEPEPVAEVDRTDAEEPESESRAGEPEEEPESESESEPEAEDGLQPAGTAEPEPEPEPEPVDEPEQAEDEPAPALVPVAAEADAAAPLHAPRMPVLGVPAPPEAAVAAPLEAPGDEEPPQDRPRRRGLLAVLIVVILLVLAALIVGGVLLASSHGPTPATSPPPAHPSTSSSPAPSSVSPSPSPSPSSPSPSPTATSSPSPSPSPSPTATSAPVSGTPTSGQLADALRTYFALLPGNTDAAWNRLTPSFQQGHAQGRDYFDSFWGDYRSVTVSRVVGQSPDRASATVTYLAKDGTRTVEYDTFRLVRQGGVLKIDGQSTG